MKKVKKATDWPVTEKMLNYKTPKNPNFSTPKWVEFCRALLADGFSMTIYEARTTFSKYITVKYKSKTFVVRFSDHRPNARKEASKHCDFFVGVNNFSITTTADALIAVKEWKDQIDTPKPKKEKKEVVQTKVQEPVQESKQAKCWLLRLFS